MFCPYCGVSNDRGETKCFVCEKPMPRLDAVAAPAAAGAPASGRARPARAEAQQLSIASVGDRMIALFFDRLVIFSILLVVAAWAADHWTGFTFASILWGALAIGGGFVLAVFLYHFISEAAFMTTLGKAAMGLHIGIEEGRGRVAGTAIRNALRIVDAIGLYLVGFLFATFTKRKQRVGDLVGKTVVLEWPIPRGGRAAIMVLVVVILAAALWLSGSICPTCGKDVPRIVGR
ncbi:MAG TPA: RDD family protein [Thermoanaerobaculia bacterium]|nr:RDD family protein [Thermoanaerobaculia bacterium]